MTRPTTCPQIIHDVQNYAVVQEKPFSIDISVLFKPEDGTLNFFLKEHSLTWLHMDQHRGVLYGVAPKVSYNKRFKFTITASNEMGYVTKSFILIVVDADIIETMPQTLELILSMRKQDYGYSHLHPYTPSLLEYLYHFFKQPEYLEGFVKSVQHAAAQYEIKVSDKMSFQEFEKVMKAINHDIENVLKQTLIQDKILTEESLNNEELENLFREGSQIPGSITIPIWNYCGNPNLYNWPHWQVFSNVLHAAADAVRYLREQNIQQSNTPELKPK